MDKIKTTTQVKEMLDLLFMEFNIKPVPVEIYNGKGAWGGKDIKIGLSVTSSLPKEDVILHEFAHTLDYRRNGNKYRRKNGRYIRHDKFFADILQEVILAWYGNSKNYHWNGEYPAVRKIHDKEV